MARLHAEKFSAIQREEMERMFFTGFAACFYMMRDELPEMSDVEGVIELERLERELRDHYKLFSKVPRNLSEQ